ncbi:MAG: 3-phosphoshikimate 1-carboxyvinyltransferase, partial [Caldimonas sp.]
MYSTRFLDLPPLEAIGGTVRVPGSKSISNRLLLLAGLAGGTTLIEGLLESDDTAVMREALRGLGCTVDPAGSATLVSGLGDRRAPSEASFHLGNSGTSVRTLTAALAVIGAMQGARFTVTGSARMHERPIGDLVEALRPLGCPIDYLGRAGFPPLLLGDGMPHALALTVPLRVRGDVSSQFLTGLLQAMVLVAADREVAIDVEGELISKPYVAITIELLRRFGVQVRHDGWRRFVVPAGSRLSAPPMLTVEGDASSASYFIAAGAIAATGEALTIDGVGSDSIQGDIAFVDAVRAMGARIDAEPGRLVVRRGRWPLAPIDLDCNHMPDAAMTLAALALFADGPSRLCNIASWRVKETDRLAAMACELRKVGASVVEGDDSIEITPPVAWRAASIATYDDHRVAMSLSLAAFNPLAGHGAGVPLRILDPRTVGKTWPDYFEALFSVASTPRQAIPVLTVDGPTASGKGTLASALAGALGYHLLDSGALYRAAALAALESGTDAGDEAALAALASTLDLHFEPGRILLRGRDVTESLRLEAVGALASRISAWPRVRTALLDLQL